MVLHSGSGATPLLFRLLEPDLTVRGVGPEVSVGESGEADGA